MSKLKALSNRISPDWNQRPFMIDGKSISHIVAANAKRSGRTKVKRSRFWTVHTFYMLAAWIAFAGALSGLAFVGAAILDSYRATKEVQEVWTQDAQGHFIPMKKKGE